MAGIKAMVMGLVGILVGISYESAELLLIGIIGIFIGIGLLFWDYSPSKKRKAKPIPTDKRLCSECGRDVPDDSNICPYCGK